MDNRIPVYRFSYEFAVESDELPAYMLSVRENARCAEAIERAIQNHYKNNSLRMDGIQAVIEDFGFERVNWVLAYNARRLSHDVRISRGNKAWAQEVSILEDVGAGAKWQGSFRILSHPGLINLCINHVREQLQLAEKQSQAPPDEQKRGEINMDYGEATSKSLAHISTGNFPQRQHICRQFIGFHRKFVGKAVNGNSVVHYFSLLP